MSESNIREQAQADVDLRIRLIKALLGRALTDSKRRAERTEAARRQIAELREVAAGNLLVKLPDMERIETVLRALEYAERRSQTSNDNSI